MAKGVNKVFLLGNVGKDPEIRATAGGTTVASFSLATADRAERKIRRLSTYSDSPPEVFAGGLTTGGRVVRGAVPGVCAARRAAPAALASAATRAARRRCRLTFAG